MNLIELHILQSFPVTCLNRDDLGAPKTAYFGGCQRARVSSQSWKRAIRAMAKEAPGDYFSGQRTRFLIRSLEKLYADKELAPDKARELAIATADSMGKLDDPEKGNVKTLLYFSPQELEQVAVSSIESGAVDMVNLILDGAKKKDGKNQSSKRFESHHGKSSSSFENQS